MFGVDTEIHLTRMNMSMDTSTAQHYISDDEDAIIVDMDFLEASAHQWTHSTPPSTEMDCLEDAAAEWAMERMADQMVTILKKSKSHGSSSDDLESEDGVEEDDLEARRNFFDPLASLGSMEISAY